MALQSTSYIADLFILAMFITTAWLVHLRWNFQFLPTLVMSTCCINMSQISEIDRAMLVVAYVQYLIRVFFALFRVWNIFSWIFSERTTITSFLGIYQRCWNISDFPWSQSLSFWFSIYLQKCLRHFFVYNIFHQLMIATNWIDLINFIRLISIYCMMFILQTRYGAQYRM
jgi:hypothetical protein